MSQVIHLKQNNSFLIIHLIELSFSSSDIFVEIIKFTKIQLKQFIQNFTNFFGIHYKILLNNFNSVHKKIYILITFNSIF